MARFSVLLLAGLLACGPAVAQTAPPTVVGPDGPAPALPQRGAQTFVSRFEAANTTHDGKLTLAQAEAAHMAVVVRHFAEVDTQHRGYITLREIRAYRQQMRGQPGGGPPDVN